MIDWQPTAGPDALRARADLLARLRHFFAVRGVLEVDTPLLCASGVTDPNIDGIAADAPLGGPRWWLQTSPEYAMKRLLAAGSGPIFQICKAFRAGEAGRLHNPEFTLVEWYRPGMALEALMDEVAALAALAVGERPLRRLTYRQAFREGLGLDPLTAPLDALRQRAAQVAGADFRDEARDTCLDLLLSHHLQPCFGRGEFTFLCDYPASQAALARLKHDDDGLPVGERFELYIDGVEIANGYHELTDAAEQAARFDAERAVRAAGGRPVPPRDDRLLAALAHGLPDCSGVALGLDRLLMLALGAARLEDVLAFPSTRA